MGRGGAVVSGFHWNGGARMVSVDCALCVLGLVCAGSFMYRVFWARVLLVISLLFFDVALGYAFGFACALSQPL